MHPEESHILLCHNMSGTQGAASDARVPTSENVSEYVGTVTGALTSNRLAYFHVLSHCVLLQSEVAQEPCDLQLSLLVQSIITRMIPCLL